MKTDTIAAIATAMTNSGIGIIRISGEDAFTVIDRIYQSKNGKKKLSEEKSHTVHYGYIVDDTKENKIIDEVMVLIMRAPNTYTREDTVEIDCHGGVLVMQKILDTVVCHGARPAEPGEFTKRAFLNGRIDLTQAESVMDVISSKNEFALKSSISQLQGSLQKEIKELREKIIYEIAFIESALDDPEHINIDGYGQKLKTVAEECKERIEHLLDTADNGKILKEGIDTVIVGKPNAGKSSLMNVLLKKERAIVTDIAGTTRDVLEEQMNLNGITLNIIDTAGIRETNDKIESLGFERTFQKLEQAEIVLWMVYSVNAASQIEQLSKKIIPRCEGKHLIVVFNKADLIEDVQKSNLSALLENFPQESTEHIYISAKRRENTNELQKMLINAAHLPTVTQNDVIVTNVRHYEALSKALNAIHRVQNGLDSHLSGDFLSQDIRECIFFISDIAGEVTNDMVLQNIFQHFCIGK